MSEKPKASLKPAMYSHRIDEIQTIGRLNGYAIAIHGSMQRDLDIIAVPWTDDAKPASELVSDFIVYMGLQCLGDDPKELPHGRLCYTLLMGGSLFMDLSIMPLQNVSRDKKEGRDDSRSSRISENT